MKNKIVKILTRVFILLLLVFIVITNINKPRVLILHSYDLDYSWVRDINEGLNRVLGNKAYSFKWHYMDTKRHPSKQFKEKAGNTAKIMIDRWNPDLIIAVDDNALQYVVKHYVNHPTIKIVFTGMNAEPSAYNYQNAKNVTGVLERIPFNEFREVFSQILEKGKNKIVHISDASTTSKLIHDELAVLNWSPLKLVKSFQCKTFDDWKKAIKKAHILGDVLLITHYHTIKDKNNKIVKPSKVMKWTVDNMKIPDIGCWGFFVEDGGMMSVAVSPYEQGTKAAEMAVKIIDEDIEPSKIKIFKNNQYVIYVRGESIKKRKLKLPKMFEAFAKATNHYY